MKIGELRRSLFVEWDCRWNGAVREVTADHETKDEEVDVSAVYAELLKIIRGYYALDRQYPHQNGSRVDQLFLESD